MRKLYIAMYHYTRDLKNSRFPKLKGLDVALFRKQIQHFSRNFSVVTMEKVIESMLGIHELPPNALLLTFDDGYIDNYVYALPVLEEYGFQGSFFVPGKIIETKKLLDVNKIHCILASADISILLKDVMERVNYYDKKLAGFNIRDIYNQNVANSRYDSREVVLVKQMLQTTLPVQVRSLIINELFEKYVDMPEEKIAQELYINRHQLKVMKECGMFIGVHGYDHIRLGTLTSEEIENDLSKALETMDEFIDNNCWVMNYPYGSYNSTVLGYIKRKGAILGLTTEVQVVDIDNVDNFKLPRLDCNDFPPISQNYKNY